MVISSYALGTLLGAGVYAALGQRRWLAWLLTQGLLVASGVLVATLTGFWLPASGMLLLGVASGLLEAVASVIFNSRIPEAMRGRVLGVYMMLSFVAGPPGIGVITGW